MITDEKSMKSAAERIQFFLEHPPHEGTPQSVEFTNLLEEVAQYQSELLAHHAGPVSTATEQARDLMRQAAALAKRDAERPRWSSFPEDGEGIGPTTGV